MILSLFLLYMLPALYFIDFKAKFLHSYKFRIVIFSCGNSSLFLKKIRKSFSVFNYSYALKYVPGISRASQASQCFHTEKVSQFSKISQFFFIFKISVSIFISFKQLIFLLLLVMLVQSDLCFKGEYIKYFIW